MSLLFLKFPMYKFLNIQVYNTFKLDDKPANLKRK